MPTLCRQLENATLLWLDKATQQFLLPPVKPLIRCDLKGKSAGQLRREHDGQLLIRYNLDMARLQADSFLEQTVPHEVAHLVVWLLHGNKARAHGPQWQAVMRAFGKTPDRCHSFEVPENTCRRQQRWPYQCQCQEHALSSTRHNRIRKGHTYICRQCGHALQPTGDSAQAV